MILDLIPCAMFCVGMFIVGHYVGFVRGENASDEYYEVISEANQHAWDVQITGITNSLRLANEDCNSLAAENASLKDLLEQARRRELGSIVGMLPTARRVLSNGKPPCEA